MTNFKKGDRVYSVRPRNESWPDHYTATVIGVSPGRIDIRWDHGPYNYGKLPSGFALRTSDAEG